MTTLLISAAVAAYLVIGYFAARIMAGRWIDEFPRLDRDWSDVAFFARCGSVWPITLPLTLVIIGRKRSARDTDAAIRRWAKRAEAK